MLVRYIKEHLGYNKGEEINLPYKQANYMIRVGVVEAVTEKAEIEPEQEKVEFKPVKEKRERKKKE